MRLWSTIAHVGSGSRTSAGAASLGVRCGSYQDGQLIVHLTALPPGGKLVPRWESSVNGLNWGLLVKGVTMIATGIQVLSPVNSIGAWARMSWAVASGATFSASFILKE